MEVLERIKAIAMDVDGVLTDGTFWWGTNNEELKRFCFADVTGLGLARQAGLKLALVSGESSPAGMALVRRYAEKLKIADVYPGCHDKAAAFRDFIAKHGIDSGDACFIGDDSIDMPAMDLAGFAVAPPNAQAQVRAKAAMVTKLGGGHGAVREVIDLILEAQAARKQRNG